MTNSIQLVTTAAMNTWMTFGGSLTVGFCTGVTIEPNGFLTPVGEPNGVGNYVPVLFDVSGWDPAGTQDGQTRIVNGDTLPLMPPEPATVAWGEVTHYIIRDSADTILAIKQIKDAAGNPAPMTINEGEYPVFNVGLNGLRMIVS